MAPPGTPSPFAATKDHPQPRSKGGGGTTVWACRLCNGLKSDMTYDAWKLYMEMNPSWWDKPISKVQAEIKEEEGNIIPFRKKEMFQPQVITGGNPPTSGNWLLDLPIGTRFSVKMKTKFDNFMCLDLEMVNKTGRTAVLWELSTGQPFGGNGRVDPVRFIQQFDFVEKLPSLEDMLEQLPQQETTEESNHGDGNRTN